MASTADPPDSIRFTLTIHSTTPPAVRPTDVSTTPRELLLERGQVMVMGRSSRSEAKQLQAANHNAFFDCPVISRRHAELSCVLDQTSTSQVAIIDRDSRHGTTVNGTKLLRGQEFILKNGDIIKLGDFVQQGPSIHDGLLLEFKICPSVAPYGSEYASSAFRGVNLSDSEDSDYESDVDSIARPASDDESANTSPPQCKLNLDLRHPRDRPEPAGIIDLSGIDDAIVWQPPRTLSSKDSNNTQAYSGRNVTEPIPIVDDDDLDETTSALKAQADHGVSADEAAGPTYMPTQIPQRFELLPHPSSLAAPPLKDAEWLSGIFEHPHRRCPLPPLSSLKPSLSLDTMPAIMHPLQPSQPVEAAQLIRPSTPVGIDPVAQDPLVDPAQITHASDLAPEKTRDPYVYEGCNSCVDETWTDDLFSSRWDIMPTKAAAEQTHENESATIKRKADDSTEADAMANNINFMTFPIVPPSSKKRKRPTYPAAAKTNKTRKVPRNSTLQKAASSAAQIAAGALIGAVSTIIFLSSPSSEWLVDWLS